MRNDTRVMLIVMGSGLAVGLMFAGTGLGSLVAAACILGAPFVWFIRRGSQGIDRLSRRP